jgi:diphthamide synthase subunit DPH2
MLKIFYRDDDLAVIQHDRYHHLHSAICQRMTILALSIYPDTIVTVSKTVYILHSQKKQSGGKYGRKAISGNADNG